LTGFKFAEAEVVVPSRVAFYPASHAQALERVMRIIDLIAARPGITEEQAVAALMRGVSARWTLSC
jgi:hypothetical protein